MATVQIPISFASSALGGDYEQFAKRPALGVDIGKRLVKIDTGLIKRESPWQVHKLLQTWKLQSGHVDCKDRCDSKAGANGARDSLSPKQVDRAYSTRQEVDRVLQAVATPISRKPSAKAQWIAAITAELGVGAASVAAFMEAFTAMNFPLYVGGVALLFGAVITLMMTAVGGPRGLAGFTAKFLKPFNRELDTVNIDGRKADKVAAFVDGKLKGLDPLERGIMANRLKHWKETSSVLGEAEPILDELLAKLATPDEGADKLAAIFDAADAVARNPINESVQTLIRHVEELQSRGERKAIARYLLDELDLTQWPASDDTQTLETFLAKVASTGSVER